MTSVQIVPVGDTDYRPIGEEGMDEQPIDTSFQIGPSMAGRLLPSGDTVLVIGVGG